MKKKITAVALIISLFAMLIAGGTFAYLKDTDTATNVFTIGDIEIFLHEDNGLDTKNAEYKLDEAYEEWLEAQVFEPSITLEKDAWIQNSGSNDAYVRMFVIWPETMDSMLNISWDAALDANWISNPVEYTYNGVQYVGRCLVYNANNGVLAAGKVTTDTITSVKLLNAVECETVDGIITYTLKDNAGTVIATHESLTGKFPVLVCAQAGQVLNGDEEWTDATSALNVMFGDYATVNPFTVNASAEFAQLIEDEAVVVDGVILVDVAEDVTSLTVDGATIKVIGDYAAVNAEALETLVLTEGVEALGNRSFREVETLKYIVLPDSLTDLGESAFQKCYALESVKIGNNVKEIPTYTFLGSGLSQVTIPESVEKIGKDAFGHTKLVSVIIPENVSYIDTYAFRACEDLREVYILSDELSFGSTPIFSNYEHNNTNDITIYVKNASVYEAVKAIAGRGVNVVLDPTIGA